MNSIVFIDSEISTENGNILDLGAIKPDNAQFHSASTRDFVEFVSGCDFICGHNIIAHDLKYIGNVFYKQPIPCPIDTLPLSPLLFPQKPYHALLKDDKLQTDELNNPLNDSIKAMALFYDEVNAFNALSSKLKWIYCALLYQFPEFQGFFKYVGFQPYTMTESTIKVEFQEKLCKNADISILIRNYPVELAYTLALIYTDDHHSITPPWVLKNYPKVENIIKYLRNTPCVDGCPYCNSKMDVNKALQRVFGYDSFRTYNGEPLQEKAADAAVHGKSLLAVFPTGGGKSITFQLPALMAGEAVHGLTVVISPLQSLMKDQVDNLEAQGVVDAVTVNGMLNPLERSEALARVESGTATILYISPEQLRSRTIEQLLLSRNIARFVIDEAHCFSAWGQDFRVDYLYIGDFIRELQQKKRLKTAIPVSCFTATAKQKVISDICDYFKKKLDLNLELFATTATRENLHYAVLFKETEEDKYNTLRTLIEQKNCPTIVYVSRTRRTRELAEKLTRDGFPAKPFNGKMDPNEKITNQEAFIHNEIKVIVATSAFGMGVDKKDVKLVIHYDISESLENYVQEAGRAGRDQSLQAECYVLFNDRDLDKHFILLNQTKLSISEIQQVWKAIKDLTKFRPSVCCSPLEIARQAGWDDSGSDIETRVKTAIAALENAGYVKRGRNMPHVYATSILAKNMQEAGSIIDSCGLFDDTQCQNAKRIIKSLISSRSIAKAGNDDAESRVDYLSDMLSIEKSDVVNSINLMREANLLADSQDMSAFIHRADSQNKSAQILEKYLKLEDFLFSQLSEEGCSFNLKELNEIAQDADVASSVKNLRTVLYFWMIKGYVQKSSNNSDRKTEVMPALKISSLREKFNRRIDVCRFIVDELYKKAAELPDGTCEEIPVQFSLIGLWHAYQENPQASLFNTKAASTDVEDALLYLSKIGALSLEGGFFVLYNGIELKRLITDNKIRYKVDDYRMLSEFYKQKIQQIHIVGEYANLMVRDYNAALKFVQDYFQMDFKQFITKYFKGERAKEINRNITPDKYNQLFGDLSEMQAKIINDDESKCIVTAAGPGSGKTRVLVHKLAALLLLDDVKHEQLLMLTFSRAAATEFKKRLADLIGNAANFVEIKTFHSYCFDLLGRIGSLKNMDNVVRDAAQMINSGEVEIGRITKRVVVIDEAQDMDENEFFLIEALMKRNDDMRVIAVGDDDQNVYEFRGSDSKYLKFLITNYGANMYEMLENYRSKPNIVALANAFAARIKNRIKADPIQAVQAGNGVVQLIRHINTNLEEPVINHILSTYQGGRACVLTNTNDEALRVVGLLTKRGIRARLIQSNDGFQLYNLSEIRFFIKEIDRRIKSPVISDEIWDDAKKRLKAVYGDSSCLDICLNLISDFESINHTKYRTDLEEFIRESNYEDFYHDEKEAILVSTIHKAKGREFDTVYMLLNNMTINNDSGRRQVYVGLTRAKNELYIHYNNDIFDSFNLPTVERIKDNREYPVPEEIILQLSHKGVVLDFFKGKKELIFKLHSGAELHFDGEYMSAEIENRSVRVAKCSKACLAHIEDLAMKGYRPSMAVVRFVVAWQGENDDSETAVILPDLFLSKQSIHNDSSIAES
ncbi:MAG: RecQ family ATP-dependent DNA helicase [Bacteroidia bacterium]|nr:RecQ family ATP-dependent DNA helicase [Bacteroidia bacterium]